MQRERVFNELALVLCLSSISAVLTFFIIRLPYPAALPVIAVMLAICVIATASIFGNFAGVMTAGMYTTFVLLLAYLAYSSVIVLAVVMLSTPSSWEVYRNGRSIKRALEYLGIKKEGFLANAILGVLTAIFVVFPLAIIEVIVVVMLLHLEKPGLVSMVESNWPIYVVIFSFTVSPIAEEVFFRGFLLDKVGIFFSTLLFALAHYSYGSWAEFLAAFTAGFIFAVMRRRTNSVTSPIFAHAAFNFINVAISILYH